MSKFHPDRIRPWRRLPHVNCEFCSAQATRRVSSMSEEWTAKGDLLLGADLSDGAAVLVCESHSHAALESLALANGKGAESGLLRMTWKQWLWDWRAPAKWLRRRDWAWVERLDL